MLLPAAPAAAAPPACQDLEVTIRQDKPVTTMPCQDTDADTMTLTVLDAPAHGDVTTAQSGSFLEFTYDPDDGFRGRDAVRATASDGTATSEPFEIALEITRNHAPVCPRTAKHTRVGEPLEVSNPGCFDTDVQDGGRLTVALDPAAPPDHGALSPADGGVTYTPEAGYSGADEIGFMATDGDLVAREVVRVHVANTAFCSPDDPLHVRPGGNAQAVALCTAPEFRSVDRIVLVTQPAKGAAGQPPDDDSALNYAASSEETGADSFTFMAKSAEFGDSPVATQDVVIDPAFNRAPECNEHDIPYIARAEEATDVRLFCHDADIDPLTYEVTQAPMDGTATVDGDTLTYTSDAGFAGGDEVGITISDDHGGALELTVPFEVLSPGGPACDPIAPITVAPDGVGFVQMRCEGADTYEIVDGPDQGIVEPNGPPDRFRYIAASFATGTDSFTLRGVNETGPGAPVTVDVTIDPGFNSAPICEEPDVDIFVLRGATRLLPLESRCGDPEGDELTYRMVTQAAHGFVTPGPAESLSYTADDEYLGPDSFTYTASDDQGATSVVRRFDVEVIDDGTTPPPPPPPAAPPPPPPPPPPASAPDEPTDAVDAIAPHLGVTAPRQRLATAIVKGVKVALRLDEPATVDVRVLLARKAARRLGLTARARRPVQVGRASRTAAAGTATLRVRLKPRARRALARARKVRLTLAVTVKDAAGNTTSRTRRLTLRR